MKRKKTQIIAYKETKPAFVRPLKLFARKKQDFSKGKINKYKYIYIYIFGIDLRANYIYVMLY